MGGPYLLGIDKGTSVTKAVLFDLEGNELAQAQAPINNLAPRPGWQEEDPQESWDTLKRVIRQALEGVDGREVAAIGAAGYMGACWTIGHDGREARNGIVWTDQRGASMVKRWREEGVTERFFDLSGNAMVAGLTLPLVAWLKAN
ncbi:MAG TPA: FGGY family carbohydrate kinase, partial [Chloroflexia bacterium]|nr:FGGY family carbohydrate kinase [Chloroflexia bacterium]